MASIKKKLLEAVKACESKRAANNEVDEVLKETRTKITGLCNTTCTLKLQLKCELNEKELCGYKLAE